nr:MAG TPA: hypothetical protein [Caudoviricetes sp.]
MSWFRSLSDVQAASFSLNSSSLILAQFNASANVPVTCPTLAVSFADSISPSMGKASPNVPATPAAISVQVETSSALSASFARSWLASVAVSVSPRIP